MTSYISHQRGSFANINFSILTCAQTRQLDIIIIVVVVVVSHTSIGADTERKREKHREEKDKKLIT